jgi:hypothetical protein
MKVARTTVLLLLTVIGAGAAHAQADKTREPVKDEAIRTDNAANRDSGLKPNELHPQGDSKPAVQPGLTRAQVRAELLEAIRTGTMLPPGQTKLDPNAPITVP